MFWHTLVYKGFNRKTILKHPHGKTSQIHKYSLTIRIGATVKWHHHHRRDMQVGFSRTSVQLDKTKQCTSKKHLSWTVSSSTPPPAPSTRRLPWHTANSDPHDHYTHAPDEPPPTHHRRRTAKIPHCLIYLPRSHKPPLPLPFPLHTNLQRISPKPTVAGGRPRRRNRPPSVIMPRRRTRAATLSTLTSPERSASTQQPSKGLSTMATRHWRSSAPAYQKMPTRWSPGSGGSLAARVRIVGSSALVCTTPTKMNLPRWQQSCSCASMTSAWCTTSQRPQNGEQSYSFALHMVYLFY